RYRGASAVTGRDQTIYTQHGERFANRRTRHAELGCQRLFAQRGSRRKIQQTDPIPQLFVDGFTCRPCGLWVTHRPSWMMKWVSLACGPDYIPTVYNLNSSCVQLSWQVVFSRRPE